MNNLDLTKQAYQNLAEGNIEAFISVWKEDIIWHASSGLPYVEGDGIFVGAKAILHGALSKLPEYIEDISIEFKEFIDSGNKVVMVGYYTGKCKQTGKIFKANATHVWTYENGKVSHFFQAVDSALITMP